MKPCTLLLIVLQGCPFLLISKPQSLWKFRIMPSFLFLSVPPFHQLSVGFDLLCGGIGVAVFGAESLRHWIEYYNLAAR